MQIRLRHYRHCEPITPPARHCELTAVSVAIHLYVLSGSPRSLRSLVMTKVIGSDLAITRV